MESFSRVGMFLTVLTGAVVALALFAQVDHFHATFQMAAILILAVVVFVGLATIGRVSTLNRENYRWVAGMNRLRHAYHEMYPDIEPYFVASRFDDLRGFGVTMSLPLTNASPLDSAAQGFQSLPAMLSVIVSTVAGLLGALIVGGGGSPTEGAAGAAVIVFVATMVLPGVVLQRGFFEFAKAEPARFRSPSGS